MIFVAKSVKDKISIKYRNASLIFPSYFSIILNLISLHHVCSSIFSNLYIYVI